MLVNAWFRGIIDSAQTAGCFPPLEACKVTSGTMRNRPWGGGIYVFLSSRVQDPVSEVYDVFCDRDLNSTTGWRG